MVLGMCHSKCYNSDVMTSWSIIKPLRASVGIRTCQSISYYVHPYIYCKLLLGWGRNTSTWIDICRRLTFYDNIVPKSRILCKQDKGQKTKRITGKCL